MPYRTVKTKAPLFMRYDGTKVYRVYRRDDADSGVFRQYRFTLDPVEGSDMRVDDRVTFDVRGLSTWQPPQRPPSPSGRGYVPANRKAWRPTEADLAEERAIKAAIRAALDKGEIGPKATCSLCGKVCDARKAHLHQGELIGDECCWDERLKASE